MSRPSWPIAVRLLNLDRPLHPLTGLARYAAVRVFVTRDTRLLGSVDIWNDGGATVSLTRLRQAIATRFADLLVKEDIVRQLGAAAADPPQVASLVVSIVVPTCDRPDDLRRCLASLVTQRTRHTVEIIVVDNRPASGAGSAVAKEFPSVRLIIEDRPGLSYARNAGIAAATGAVIVATDDDVTAPEGWVEGLVAPFVRSEVMCVTGNVLPLELETEAQVRFEDYGGLGKGFTAIEADGAWFATRRGAVPTWLLGATANAAFRATVFRDPRVGLLDEALGAGMPTGCSEDTYLFYRILKAGGTIVYDPSAYVWHRHRTSMAALRAQIRAYSRGHVAYHLTTLLRDRDHRSLVRLFYSLPMVYLRRALHRMRGWSRYPLSMVLLEIRGNLEGPFALWQARRRVRRWGRSAPALSERSNVVSMEGPFSKGSAA